MRPASCGVQQRAEPRAVVVADQRQRPARPRAIAPSGSPAFSRWWAAHIRAMRGGLAVGAGRRSRRAARRCRRGRQCPGRAAPRPCRAPAAARGSVAVAVQQRQADRRGRDLGRPSVFIAISRGGRDSGVDLRPARRPVRAARPRPRRPARSPARCSPVIVQKPPSAAISCAVVARVAAARPPRAGSRRGCSPRRAASRIAATWSRRPEVGAGVGRRRSAPRRSCGGAGRARPRPRRPAASGRTRGPSRASGSGPCPSPSTTVSSDWSTSDWTSSSASSPEQRVGAGEREAVVEDREPAQRPALALGEQVPRPVDDRHQGLVPVGRAAVAAAQQREPVVEPAVDVLDRHHAHLGRGQLDRQRQPVEAAYDAAYGLVVEARRPGRAAEARWRNRSAAASSAELAAAGRPARRRSPAARGWW